MSDKVLTISVAAFNSEKYLRKCLDSLLIESIINDIEVIVVNDGSTDNTGVIAEEYAERFPYSLKVINKENGGHGSTINQSIMVGTGKYYKIVDADDWVEADGIIRLIDTLKKSDADIVINPYYQVDPGVGKKTEEARINSDHIIEGQNYSLSMLPEEYYMPTHSLTFRTEILRKNWRMIDEHCFYVDREYVLFPLVNADSFIYYSFFVYDYLFGSEEQSCSRQNMIKRVDQHFRVCQSLIQCYLSNKYSDEQKRIMINGITDIVHVQYGLLFEIGDAGAKDKFRKLDHSVRRSGKAINKRLFSGITFKYKLKLIMLRLSGYSLFGWFCRRTASA